jgi:hypothetical protein
MEIWIVTARTWDLIGQNPPEVRMDVWVVVQARWLLRCHGIIFQLGVIFVISDILNCGTIVTSDRRIRYVKMLVQFGLGVW